MSKYYVMVQDDFGPPVFFGPYVSELEAYKKSDKLESKGKDVEILFLDENFKLRTS